MTTRRRPIARERSVQQQIVMLLRSLGSQVYTLGTTRRAGDYHGTMQTPGLPDVMAFLPARGERKGRLVMIEVKAPGGRARPDQLAFQDACRATGVAHVLGGLDQVVTWLVDEQYLRADQIAHFHTDGGVHAAARARA